MAIDNLPLFNAVNDEEVGHPAHPGHGHPSHPFDCAPHGRPFTRQEAHYEIMHRVEACIAEVHRFEERVRYEVNKFMQSSNTENQAFKEALQAAHNCFLETVQNEVNNFEQTMRNDYDLLRSDLDQRFADFTTAINNAFESLSAELTQSVDVTLNNFATSSEALLEDLRQLRMNLNGDYTAFVNQVNNNMQSYQDAVDGKIEEQNEAIMSARRYLEDNLPYNARIALSQMIANGELDVLMETWFGTDHLFRGAYTYAEGTSLEEIEVGDYFFCTDNDHFYMYGQTAHSYISEEPNGPPPEGYYLWFDIGTAFVEVNQLKTAVNDLYSKLNSREIAISVQEVGYFARNGALVKEGTTCCISWPVPVLSGMREIVVEVATTNESICRLVFSNGKSIYNGVEHVVGVFNPTDIGTHTVPIPEGATDIYVCYYSSEVAGTNPYPRLYVPNYDTTLLGNVAAVFDEVASVENELLTKLVFNPANCADVNLTFDTKLYCQDGFVKEHDSYSLSNPISVSPGEVFSCNVPFVNNYVAVAVFSPDGTLTVGAQYEYIKAIATGEMLIVVPAGVNYMFISDCRDYSAAAPENPPTLKRIRKEIYDNAIGVVKSVAVGEQSVEMVLPEKIDLVVGDEFELFYSGLVNACNPSSLSYYVSCTIGKPLTRKFVVTPTKAGTYNFSIKARNVFNGVVGSASTTLNVVDKMASEGVRNVLVIGDSLTESGYWVAHAANRLSADGHTINFVGRRGSNVHYEATGGYRAENYIKLDTKNPFYDAETGTVNFAKYIDTYCNSKVDIVCILLGWNSIWETDSVYKTNMRALIDMITAACPDAQILVMGIQRPSFDGLGWSYSGAYDPARWVSHPFRLNRLNSDIVKDYENARFIPIAPYYDDVYGAAYSSQPANRYSSVTEVVGTNGIHPSLDGYKLIGDVIYRTITALLQE